MWEFFQVVDATHDDPTLYPVLSAPSEVLPFEVEPADGTQPRQFMVKRVSVLQHTGGGWTQLRRFSDLKFTVVITEARVLVFCEKFVKGGGWWGFGAGGLAVALVANAVSHARAAARRKGKLLVAQVRYPWLARVAVVRDKRGRVHALRLTVDAGSPGGPRWLALDIAMSERAQPELYAATIAGLAARFRLSSGSPVPETEFGAWENMARDPAAQAGEASWSLPSAAPVGMLASPVAGSPPALAPAPATVPPASVPPTATPHPRQPTPEAPLANSSRAERTDVSTGSTVPDVSPIHQDVVPAMSGPVEDTRCRACGHARTLGQLACSRCGMPFDDRTQPPEQASTDRAALEATINRSILARPSAVEEAAAAEQSLVPQPLRPPPVQPHQAQPGIVSAYGNHPEPSISPIAAAQPPPEVWLVGIGLIVLAAILLDPVLRYGAPLLGHLFDSDRFTRAVDDMFLEAFVIIAGCGVALIALAISLFRGSRVAQIIACVLSAALAIAVLAGDVGQRAVSAASALPTFIAAVCIAVILLLTARPTARAFFARDTGRPFGVLVAAVIGTFLGASSIIAGVLLVLAGSFGVRLVWWGLVFLTVGLGLVAVNRPLRAGWASARLAATVLYLGYVVIGFVVTHANRDINSPTTIIPLGLAAAAIAGLFGPASSNTHFTTRRPLAAAPLANAGSAIAVVIAVVAAATGFSAASKYSNPVNVAGVQPSYSQPAYSQPTYSSTYPSNLTASVATADVQTTLQTMQSDPYAVYDCAGGTDISQSLQSYSIGDVTPQTDGTFLVYANVTLQDGSVDEVSFLVSDSASDCIESVAVQTPAAPTTPAVSEPTDVPSLPAASDPVPTGAALPGVPSASGVVAYTDAGTIPTTPDALVEWQPAALSADDTAAVQDVISFMTYINQQDFQDAWTASTESLSGTTASSAFQSGYATTHFYQVAFGQPEDVTSDLIVIPARFISRQDPTAQGNPSGVTQCTYWPQYVFVVARSGGSWLDDVAGTYQSSPQLDPFKRPGTDGGRYLNPLAQRVSC